MLRALALVSVVAGVAHADPRIGDAAPALSLTTVDGGTFTLAAGERPVVVDFFATWCEPCHHAVAALGRLARDQGFDLVIVDVNETPDAVAAYVAAHPMPPRARLVLDRDGDTARRWGEHRFPTTFLLDGTLAIRHINRGYGPGYEQRLRGWLGALTRRRATITP